MFNDEGLTGGVYYLRFAQADKSAVIIVVIL
jgi:hypothetical protein